MAVEWWTASTVTLMVREEMDEMRVRSADAHECAPNAWPEPPLSCMTACLPHLAEDFGLRRALLGRQRRLAGLETSQTQASITIKRPQLDK